MARALDRWWDELGRPDPFPVVEAGAGTGTLAGAVRRAGGRCAGALRYLEVERSDRLRVAGGRAELPAQPFRGVVLANELLDNLPFLLLERRDGRWMEVRVGEDRGDLVEVLAPAATDVADEAESRAPGAPDGARVPLQRAAARWLREALALVTEGRVVVVDYADTTASMAARPWRDWLRTYRAHTSGGHPLDRPGTQDVTCEVAVDQLAAVRPPVADRPQAEFLAAHGIGELVAAARAEWAAGAAVGDLAALRARSRVAEAVALCDPTGLGAFRVLEWRP